ncbi:hypothetical protein AAMO2058_001347800 [Amorphochlora amoebiformis]
MLLYAVFQFLSYETNPGKRNFHILTFAGLFFFFFWIVGAHEPVYFGWRAYLILNSVAVLLIALASLLVTYLIARASYAALNLKSKLPKSMDMTYGCFSVFVVTFELIGICLTLGYDEERYNAFRHFANTLVVAFAGSYLEISFFVLRREIHKLHKGISKDKTSGSKVQLDRLESTDAVNSLSGRKALRIMTDVKDKGRATDAEIGTSSPLQSAAQTSALLTAVGGSKPSSRRGTKLDHHKLKSPSGSTARTRGSSDERNTTNINTNINININSNINNTDSRKLSEESKKARGVGNHTPTQSIKSFRDTKESTTQTSAATQANYTSNKRLEHRRSKTGLHKKRIKERRKAKRMLRRISHMVILVPLVCLLVSIALLSYVVTQIQSRYTQPIRGAY